MHTPIDLPRAPRSPSFDALSHDMRQDMRALREHLQACRACHGRLFALRCAAESVDRFLASRFVTTVAFAAVLVGAGSMMG